MEKHFTQSGQFQIHEKYIHGNSFNFKCQECERFFLTQKTDYKAILIQFTMQKYINVTVVTMLSRVKDNYLDTKMFISQKKRSNVSELFNKELNGRVAFSYHFKIIHKKQKDHKCDFCPLLFGSFVNLNKHNEVVHKGITNSSVKSVVWLLGIKMV